MPTDEQIAEAAEAFNQFARVWTQAVDVAAQSINLWAQVVTEQFGPAFDLIAERLAATAPADGVEQPQEPATALRENYEQAMEALTLTAGEVEQLRERDARLSRVAWILARSWPYEKVTPFGGLSRYTCRLCGGVSPVGRIWDSVKHADDCVWLEAKELGRIVPLRGDGQEQEGDSHAD